MPDQLMINSWARAIKYIPNGCQTLSKRPETYVNGVYPKILTHGHGCEVYDEDDKPYTDYISSLGAILLGYNDLYVDSEVCKTINEGQLLLSLPHPREADLAERLSNPNLNKVKFFKTGSEATSAAVRVARSYTGRSVILKCGYNGWHDWAMIQSRRPSGIPLGLESYTDTFKYNNFQSVEAAFNRKSPIAAVILEPIIYEEPKDGFLEKLVSFAHSRGALVIFDEIVTGLRFGLGGASSLFGVIPDLSCLGKALGNGYPISVLTGNDKYMHVFDKDDFIASGTFSGDLIGITAALAVLDTYEPKELWSNGMALKIGFNKICNDLGLSEVSCIGYAPRTKFEFPTISHRALFWQECIKRGVMFGYTNFVTTSHKSRVIEMTLNVCNDALVKLKKYWSSPREHLEGDLPKVVL